MRGVVRLVSPAWFVPLGLALLLFFNPAGAQQSAPLRLKKSEEIAPYRLTGYDAYAVLRYSTDQINTTGQPSGPSQSRKNGLVEEVHLMTHSYIYHPSLVTLDLGGGPLIDRTGYYADGVVSNYGRQVYNLSGRATVLKDKPYTGVLFFDHSNQTQDAGPAQTMQTASNRYGLGFSLLKPVTPAPLRVELERSDNKGKSEDQITDDKAQHFKLKLDYDIGTLGSTVLQFQNSRMDSLSGNANLPIRTSTTQNNRLTLDTNLTFGDELQYELVNNIVINTHQVDFSEGPGLDLSDLHFNLDVRAEHSADLQSYGHYAMSQSKQNAQSTSVNALSGGFNYRLTPELRTSLSARGETNRSDQASTTLYGLNGSANYVQPLLLGTAQAGYTFGYMQREQQASAQQARVLDERIALAGTSWVALLYPRVVADSVTVNNGSRTQTFVEGADYLLSVVGTTTRIQRILGGNIRDGEEVLVDYAYELGGSYGLKQLDQMVHLGWNYKSYFKTYLNFTDSAPRVTSGTPTFEPNPARTRLFGLNSELPLEIPYDLLWDVMVGATAEREQRREEVAPYQRVSIDKHVQVGLPWVKRGNIRFAQRRFFIDYENSPLGTNVRANDVRLWALLPYNINVSLDASKERDTGSPILRERSFLQLKAKWRKRKLQWSADLSRTRELQGSVERTRMLGQFVLRRDF